MNHLTSSARAGRGAFAAALAVVLVVACRHEDAPPTQTVYQNGYPQTQQQAYGTQVTYQNGYPQQGYYAQQPPAPQGAPPATAPAATAAAPAATTAPAATAPAATAAPSPAGTGTMIGAVAAPAPTMAVPGVGAIPCQNDAQCILGRCNVQYGRCAYPCKNTAADCASNAVCGPLGLCVPNVQIQQQTPR